MMKIKLLLMLICVVIWYCEYRSELKDIMSEYGGEKH